MSYICKESDILYLDKELFTYENKAFSERYTALYRDGHSQATNEDVVAPDRSTRVIGPTECLEAEKQVRCLVECRVGYR